ncbi:MAG: PDDEXK nuclease domain-containing protein [Spirosomaceae bacterium]|jgi:predicted nuclease of restriction endonuclease-like (RecB) superfamily|nr:PDDEXK nuclease domain-containing protein [Spirosomataceae bacterium]
MAHLYTDDTYKNWLAELKSTIQTSQVKAAIAVNTSLIKLYWDLGKQIVEKQETAKWGSGFIDQLSKDLSAEFPAMKSLSAKNLRNCRQFYQFYSDSLIWKQLVSKLEKTTIENHSTAQIEKAQLIPTEFENRLFSIPWGHHILIMQKNKSVADALFYINQTIENNWSRAVLEYQIETQLHKRQGNAITNFTTTLPKPESDLAQQLLKDPYNFEFLTLEKSAKEKDLERELTNNITQFLLELGRGFAYLGKQFTLKIGLKEYRTDLLFYHIKLRRYIVIELKLQEFQPEFIGKLNFYISAINELLKTQSDNDTIGILLCKNKDNFEVDFALKDVNKPIGVSEFTYKELPEEIRNLLPNPDEMNSELKNRKIT